MVENLTRVTDKDEVIELLSKFSFTMYNKQNDYEGELTTLDKKDIDDILADMKNRFGGAKVYKGDEMVIVEYPYNICKLVSEKLL